MKHKKDHHYTMLIGAFVLVVLAASIIFMTQFNAQVGEAGRMNIKTPYADSDPNVIKVNRGEPSKEIITVNPQKPKLDPRVWEEAEKKGLLIDPGYGIPDFEIIEDSIIINDGEYKPKLVLYDPRWHEDIMKMLKKKEPSKPLPPSLEELGRIKKSGSWTCYYDENGNFVRAWKVSRIGQNVEINEDLEGSHNCPKTTEVKKIEPTPPAPIVGEPSIPSIGLPEDSNIMKVYND